MPSRYQIERRGVRQGLTAIELLAATVILAVLMALAAPVYLSAVSSAQQNQCRANMQTLANAEEQYKIHSATHAYTTALDNLSQTIPGIPQCPDGGTYSIVVSDGTMTAQNGQIVPKGGLIIACSIAGHGKFAPGLDSQ